MLPTDYNYIYQLKSTTSGWLSGLRVSLACGWLLVRVWPGPRLMMDTQHSTLKTQCIWMGESWVWSVNPECRVLSIHHKFWAQALNLWRFLSILHLKLQHQIHIFEWGIVKCGRIHILCSGILNQIHGVLSVECWVSVISLGPGHIKDHHTIVQTVSLLGIQALG